MTVHGQSNMEVFFGRQVFRDIDADIYHVQEPNIAGYQALRAMPDRVHLVTSMNPLTRHDWWIQVQHSTWRHRARFAFQYYYENGPPVHLAVRRASGVYVEADFLKPLAQQVYRLPELPGLLPKPVDIPTGPFKKADRPVCVFLGRLDPIKRPERFFELAARMPDIEFVAVGKAHEPAYQQYLERTYFGLPNVTSAGLVDVFDGRRLSEILSRARVLVHPSAREGLSTAFQEASGHEMAILAYVNPGNYVSQFGRVAPEEGGVDALERELRQLLSTNEWREKGIAGREWNLAHHSTEISIAEHLRVYHEHLERRGVAGSRGKQVPAAAAP
jgi:glycosyltransferase involved in cell wall biosynthesis